MRSKANQKRLHDLSVMQSRADAQESEVHTFIKEIRRYAAIEKLPISQILWGMGSYFFKYKFNGILIIDNLFSACQVS